MTAHRAARGDARRKAGFLLSADAAQSRAARVPIGRERVIE
ncbi:hypothetical protein V4E86_11435 [Burkholderia pseudomallei]|uniref:Uncharacterized protein n=1 Tax=Burkholderia pseudomallei (strain 1106a) TaxID=357348 RepID=A3NYG6_BURP0|nr:MULTISPECIES: hypothetical protein [pseudomallei group]ABN83724.1 hypothetical protein BURPS668_3113 [Burkholderia pseudomallei 668]ABN89521.1 hypothetical protein BURPS1106A_3149 [Burkholderia pseudomallei 1106a]EDK53599.1 hypothetical protein BMAFMH_0228 [Burkholderia mallei FMH]EDK58569.1 hypothetical protein BMAJHU_0228 [Burkholderia mallei JHU]EDO86077.1 hypothetical protein BURPS406E_K0152 [Burkholderia pseudomallei 406e]EDO95092.1 hypothetical protein BURPSPAST_AB0261 [Burkholderia 